MSHLLEAVGLHLELSLGVGVAQVLEHVVIDRVQFDSIIDLPILIMSRGHVFLFQLKCFDLGLVIAKHIRFLQVLLPRPAFPHEKGVFDSHVFER